jgi:uncharacterized protein (DUF488 family)
VNISVDVRLQADAVIRRYDTIAMNTVWTIGHSTRSIDDLIQVLRSYDIELVADVRRYPGSRRLPQFSAESLEKSLADAGIDYRWIPALGGRRRSESNSQDSAWKHPAFRAYAEHIMTDEFSDGLNELLMLSEGLNTAIMCAEVLWWRCHRRIISDVLVSLGMNVVHIRDESHSDNHKLAPPARLIGGSLVYTIV